MPPSLAAKKVIQLNIENLEFLSNLNKFREYLDEILKTIIFENEIKIVTIDSRVKEEKSIQEKFIRKEYNSIEEMTDILGFRIITYVKSDLLKIQSLIKSFFDTFENQSVNKSILLEHNKIGYSSIHLICRIRNCPDIFKDFINFKFEIQLRTLLQHAWAEYEHKNNYKANYELSDSLKRRLFLISGTLELLDNEFDSIDIEISNSIIQSLITEEYNSGTIKKYVDACLKRFHKTVLKPGREHSFNEESILDLYKYGIDDIKKLSELFSNEFITNYDNYVSTTSYSKLIRDAMMFDNMEKYFNKVYSGRWNEVNNTTRRMLESKYGKNKVELIFVYNRINQKIEY